MAFVHSKLTVVKLGAKDLTAFSSNAQFERTSDSHDVTTFGKDDHVFNGGLGNGTATISGFYDTTAVSGPRAAIEPLLGTVVQLTRQPEGVGTGKPQDVVDVLVIKYTETSPVADYVTFSVDLQLSGAVNSTVQV